jgi:mannose-6-phosphate isomerase-like protein (cupin superfamily)
LPETVNLAEKFTRFDDHWAPRIVGELNGQYVKLAKLEGEFVWHHHDEEDELFYVTRGELRIELEDGELLVREGEFAIIPRGVRHRPVAEKEVHVMLFEPRTTLNTGDVQEARTVEAEWI